MDLAKELVEQQVFFRRELSERVGWFIGLRWIAVGSALAGLLWVKAADLYCKSSLGAAKAPPGEKLVHGDLRGCPFMVRLFRGRRKGRRPRGSR